MNGNIYDVLSATFMESEWQDEGFRNLDTDSLPHTSWNINTDYASPDPALNLRPLGRGKPLVKQSSPKDSFYSTKSNDTLDSENAHDLSSLSDSVYMTPGENHAIGSCTDKSETDDLKNGVHEEYSTKSTADNTRKNLMNSLQADYEAEDSDDATVEKIKDIEHWRDCQERDKNTNNNTDKGVTEQKSAIRKSIVDWFDYEPPAVEKVKNGVKLEEKRLETKKKLDSTSMEIIENDVALKYAPTKDLSKKKTKKVKEKKHGKINILEDSIKQETDKALDSSAFENDLQQAIIESLQDSGNASVTPADSSKKSSDGTGDENIDWWAIGEGDDTRYCEGDKRKSVLDNIYIDNGPDVIIEDEIEQDVDEANNVINAGSDGNLESQEIKDCERHFNVMSEADKCLSESSGREIDNVDVIGKHKHDNFAFEVDDEEDDELDDEKWESESSDDINVNDWVGLQQDLPNYQHDFPVTDLRTVVPARNEDFVSSADTSFSDKRYDSNFPNINLAEFVNVSEDCDIDERPRATRWVPGRRKCMNCYSEDHTTESCHNFVIMQ